MIGLCKHVIPKLHGEHGESFIDLPDAGFALLIQVCTISDKSLVNLLKHTGLLGIEVHGFLTVINQFYFCKEVRIKHHIGMVGRGDGNKYLGDGIDLVVGLC